MAAVAAVLGGLVIAVALIAWMILTRDEGTQFAAPGRVTVELRPGAHLVWNDYRTVFAGRAYDSEEQMPAEASIRVRDPGGAEVATRRSGSHTVKTSATDRNAVRAFEVVRAGPHEIAVEGAFAPRILSVSPDQTFRFFGAVFGAIAAAMFGLAAGFGLWMWAYFRRDAAAEAAGSPRPALASPGDASLRRLTAIVYALQLAGYFTLVSPIGGALINYLKRDEAAGTWMESHFRWQLRSFWITLAGVAVGVATLAVFVGFFILGVTLMWFLYRAIKGWIELSEGKPMYAG